MHAALTQKKKMHAADSVLLNSKFRMAEQSVENSVPIASYAGKIMKLAMIYMFWNLVKECCLLTL